MENPLRPVASITTVLLGALPSLLMGQNPGQDLSVGVTVDSIAVLGDTTTMFYLLENDSRSNESLFSFTVDAPSAVLRINTPSPTSDWLVLKEYRGQSVAEWAVLSDQMDPGETSPRLEFSAVGLPGIVSAWYRGYVAPPSLGPGDTIAVVEPSNPLIENSVEITSIGIEAVVSPSDPDSLSLRLEGLLDDACAEEWMDPTDCDSLESIVDDIASHVSADEFSEALTAVGTFLSSLDTNRAPSGSVVPEAYWLLRTTGERLEDGVLDEV